MSTLVKVGDEDTILTSKRDSNGQKRETYISEEGKNDDVDDDVNDIKHERKGFVQDWNGDSNNFNVLFKILLWNGNSDKLMSCSRVC